MWFWFRSVFLCVVKQFVDGQCAIVPPRITFHLYMSGMHLRMSKPLQFQYHIQLQHPTEVVPTDQTFLFAFYMLVIRLVRCNYSTIDLHVL